MEPGAQMMTIAGLLKFMFCVARRVLVFCYLLFDVSVIFMYCSVLCVVLNFPSVIKVYLLNAMLKFHIWNIRQVWECLILLDLVGRRPEGAVTRSVDFLLPIKNGYSVHSGRP